MGKVNIKQLNYAPDTGYVIGSGAGGVPIWKVEGGAGSVAWADITGNQADINLSGFTNDSGFITGNQTITLSGDVTGSGTTGITTVIANNAVTNAKFRQSVGSSIVGRSASTAGNVADIVGAAGTIMFVGGDGTLSFGTPSAGFVGANNNWVVFGSGGRLAQSGNFTYNGTDFSVGTGTINASAGYKFNGAATSGHYLRGNGTNFVSSLIQASDITTAGGITGSLTTGYLPKAASASSLTNSLLYETGQTVAVGTNTAIDAFSRFYVFGGSNGANLDVRPGGGGYNQAIIDLQSDDFSNNFQSTYLVHYGTGAIGTTYGTANAELGLLSFSGLSAAIRSSFGPLQIGIGSDEKMRVTSTGVTVGSQTATGSAILEASSTTQGFLSPRMTTAQKNAIATPATGLQLVDTDLDRPAYKTASGWESLAFTTDIPSDPTITLSGDVSGSGTTSITTTIANNTVNDGKLRQSAGLSVIGRSANSTGNVADITASTDGHVLRRSGTTLGFGLVPLSSVSATSTQVAFGSTGASLSGSTQFLFNNITSNRPRVIISNGDFARIEFGTGSDFYGLSNQTIFAGFSTLNESVPALNFIGIKHGGSVAAPSDYTTGATSALISFNANVYRNGNPREAASINFSGDGVQSTSSYSGKIVFSTSTGSANSTERMRLTKDGYLGINNTLPTSFLDVSGDIETGSANAFYFGDPTTDGTWRTIRSGNDLLHQRREAGAWVTKQTITP